MCDIPESITVDQLQHYQTQENVVLMDIRPSEVFAQGHVTGAISVPAEQLSHALNTLADDKHYIVLCPRGQRAIGVAQILREHDFHASVLVGGLASLKD